MNISIIIPVFNVEKQLERCINSVLSQTYKNLEIILVNDGSTDRSGEICSGAKKIDNRITVIHQKNKGLSEARNSGMSVASGDYIYFLDSDDYIDVNAIKKLTERAKESDADIIIGNYSIVNEKNEITKRDSFIKEKFIEGMWESSAEKFRYFFGRSYGTIACNKLYKINFLKKITIKFERNDLIFAEDLLFNMKVFINEPSIELVNYYSYFYYKVGDSITTTYKSNLAKRYLALLKSFYLYACEIDKLKNSKDLIAFYSFTAIDVTCLNEYEYSKNRFKSIKANLKTFANDILINEGIHELSKGYYINDVPRKDWRIFARIFSVCFNKKLFNICASLEWLRFFVKNM